MLDFVNRISIIFLVCAIAACALPRPDFENQQFVPRKDIVTASLVGEGVTLYQAGRMYDAENKFRLALTLYPDADNIKSNLAATLKNTGNYVESVQYYNEIIKSHPDNQEYKIGLADTYFKSNRRPEAMKIYLAVLDTYINKSEFLKALGVSRTIANLYFLLGDERLALCYSELALGLNYSQDELLKHVRFQIAFGYSSDAYELLRDWASINNAVLSDTVFLKSMAMAKYADGKFSEAYEFLDLSNTFSAFDAGKDMELRYLTYFLRDYKTSKSVQQTEEELEKAEAEKLALHEGIKSINEQSKLFLPTRFLEDLKKLEMEDVE